MKGLPVVDNNEAFGALLTDLSKTFDCLPHVLLIAKLNACWFRLKASKLMNDFQGNQKTKSNESHSSWLQIRFGVPQGSVLRRILVNIFLSDLLLIFNDYFASYADDNTLYKTRENVDTVAEILRISAEKLFKWSKDNQMNSNTDRIHLRLSTGDSNQIQIRNSLIKGILCQKLLRVIFDH